MNFIRYFFSIVSFLACIAIPAASQQGSDVIYLKDGEIIKGVILTESPGVNLQIRAMNNNILTLDYSVIDRIVYAAASNQSTADQNAPSNIQYQPANNNYVAVGNNPVTASSSILGKSYLSVGINEYYYHYSEDWSPQLIGQPYTGTPQSIEYGSTTQIHIEGRYYLAPKTPYYGGFVFGYGSGTHNYLGSWSNDSGQDTVTFYPLSFTKTNAFTTISAFVGPYFPYGNVLWALRGGLLYYYWNRGSNATIPGSYSEDYSWLYLPIGGGG